MVHNVENRWGVPLNGRLSPLLRQEETSRSDPTGDWGPKLEANSRRVAQTIHAVDGEKVLKWVTLPTFRPGKLFKDALSRVIFRKV